MKSLAKSTNQFQKQKILIFAFHKRIVSAIAEFLKNELKIKFIKIDGETSSTVRQDLCDEFQDEDLEYRVGLLSIAAACTGLNLTKATSVIFTELCWSPTMLLQAEDRAHRIGSTSDIQIVYLIVNKSPDEQIW